MDIVFNITGAGYTDSYFAPLVAMWVLIVKGGWVVLLFAIILGLWWAWITWRKNLYDASIKNIILAIDVPKENEQTPKAVENIFSHLHGVRKGGNLLEKILKGYNQQGFSLEIISIGGYIQFLIRTPEVHRDLVEAAIYAQYPNAEITEVEDYTQRYKVRFPNDEYDIYGCHYKLEKNDVYPIRTYVAFEDSSTKEVFKDPMASLLEILSRVREGEEIWLQFVIAPQSSGKWREKGIRVIRKLIGAKTEKKGKDALWLPRNIVHGVSESFTASIVPPSDMAADEESKQILKWPTMIQHLPAWEKNVVEAVGIKISKITFVTKMRLVYLARKDIFKRKRLIPAIEGALKQYNTLDLNGLRRDKKSETKVVYPPFKSIVEWRQNNRKRRILWGYIYRSGVRGRSPFVLNIEELATLYHFPIMTVKAPMVKKTEAKKAEPPVALPLEQVFPLRKKGEGGENLNEVLEKKAVFPENLPFA
ncbi:MAG: hypothetical protein ABIH38_02010 [Patescibacteria group bacterium]